jgi:hypothetical protein
MSAGTYLTKSGLITDQPCILKSIIVVNDGQSEAYVDVYDGQAAETGYKVARCYCDAKLGFQYRWDDLAFDRGLYIEFDNHADHCTVEWVPVGYPWKRKERVEYTVEPTP